MLLERSSYYKCSECGKVFYVSSSGQYTYKISPSNLTKSEYSSSTIYQCCYTCYDHARLRLTRSRFIEDDKFKEMVIRSEKAMKVKGLEILHPIEKRPK